MKIRISVAVLACCILSLCPVYGQTNAVVSEEPSPWAQDEARYRVEYQLRYLMDAEIEAYKLKGNGTDADALIEYLGEAMASLYEQAVEAMSKKPNPKLLDLLLKHHKKYYQGSASESWWDSIGALKNLRKGEQVEDPNRGDAPSE